MSTTEQIRKDAEELAMLRNARVIARAFREASISCPHCKFPENAGKFYSLLYSYTRRKIDVHRADRFYDSWRRGSMHDLEVEAAHLRTQLSLYWPCDDCTRKYNPTGRLRVKHIGVKHTVHKLTPEKKDFLE